MALSIGELIATLDVDDRGLTRGLDEADLRMRGFERDATGNLRRVDGSLVETAVAAREMGAEVARSADRARLATVGLQRDASGTLRDMRGRYVSAGDAAERFGHQMLGSTHEASQGLRGLADDAERALGERGVSGRVGLVRTALGGLTAVFGSLGRVAGGSLVSIARYPVILGATVPIAAALAQTLADIAPAGALAATGIVTAVTAAVGFKLAMSGVGTAIKDAFNPALSKAGQKQLEQTLAGLAPPARAFVLTLRSMKPALDALRLDVQGEFFAGLASKVKTLGGTLLPTLRTQLGSTGMVLNAMATSVLATATALGRQGVFGRALDAANNSLYDLAGLPAMILRGIMQLAVAAGPAFNRLTQAAAKGMTEVSGKLNTAFASGGLSRAINNAVGILRNLGGIAKNIGSVIGSLFKAADAQGSSWVVTLRQITAGMAAAFASPTVQSGLSALFATVKSVAGVLSSLSLLRLDSFAQVFTIIGPSVQGLVRALSAGLRPIMAALGPVVAAAAFAAGQLVDAAAPLLPIVGQMIAQLGPLLTPALVLVGQLFGDLAPVVAQLGGVLLPPFTKIVGAVGKAFSQAAPLIDDAVQQLGQGGLMPVIAGLGVVLDQFVTQYAAQFLDVLGQLLPTVPLLIPVFVQLGQSLGQVLTAVAPLLPQLMLLSTQFLTALLPAVLPLIPPLAQLITLLTVLAAGVITKVVVPALKGLVVFLGGLRAALQPAIDAVTWLVTTISGLFEWLYDHLVGHSVIPDMVREITAWLGRLPGMALSALAGLPVTLAGVAAHAAARMVGAVRTGVGQAVTVLGGLGGRALRAVGDLGGVLWGAGQSLMSGFIGGISSMIGSLKSKLGDITSMLPDLKGPASRDAVLLRPNGRLLIGGLMAGIADTVPALRTQLGGLTGGMSGMLGAGFGGPLVAGSAFGGGAGSAAAGGGTVRLVIDVTGGDDDLKRMIRRWVRIEGGGGPNAVQIAFGRG